MDTYLIPKSYAELCDMVKSRFGINHYSPKDSKLHLLTKLGHLKEVKHVMQTDHSQMYLRNSDGETPIYLAAKDGHLDILRIMIKYFRSKNEDIMSLMSHDKENALHAAIKCYHSGVAFWLIKHVPDLVYRLNADGESPLYVATEGGHGEIVKLILEIYQIDMSRKGKDKFLLHAAARSGSAECVKYLLNSNHDLLYQRSSEQTVLDVAVCIGHLSVAKALLDDDSSIGYHRHWKDGRKISVIHSAVEQDQSKILELLMSKCPGSTDITDSDGNNILHVAIEKKRRGIIEFIFKHKSFVQLVNQKNNEGNTPIHLLVLQAFDESITETVAKYASLYFRALERCAELQSKPEPKAPPVMVSESKSELEFDAMKYITDHRVNLIVINKKSQTPITILTSPQARRRLLKAINTRKWKINDAYLSDEAQRHFQMMDQIVIVAALIATASFAAAFTVPGGFDGNAGPKQGMPVFLRESAYKAFVVTNSLAFICSCSVLFENIRMLLNHYTKNRIVEDELDRINGRTFAMYVLIGMAMVTMAISFITGTYVVLTPSLGFGISLFCTYLVIFVSASLLSSKLGRFIHKIMYPMAMEKIMGQSFVD